MKTSFKLSTVFAAAALALAGGAQAQNAGTGTGTGTGASSGYSMYAPGATYFGINAGQSKFRLNNGGDGFAADSGKTAYSLYGGSYFSNNLGLELGYTDFGRINRAGGSTKADAFNVSLVGKLPLSPSFNLLGRLGTTYGRTDVSTQPASGITGGSQSSWNMSYGIGAQYSFTSNLSAVLQYDEYRMKFAGTGTDRINTTMLGLRYAY